MRERRALDLETKPAEKQMTKRVKEVISAMRLVSSLYVLDSQILAKYREASDRANSDSFRRQLIGNAEYRLAS
jgi:hypothetical protein